MPKTNARSFLQRQDAACNYRLHRGELRDIAIWKQPHQPTNAVHKCNTPTHQQQITRSSRFLFDSSSFCNSRAPFSLVPSELLKDGWRVPPKALCFHILDLVVPLGHLLIEQEHRPKRRALAKSTFTSPSVDWHSKPSRTASSFPQPAQIVCPSLSINSVISTADVQAGPDFHERSA